MDTVPNAARYPIPQDDRLTDLVVGLVGDLLQHHGFPAVFSGPDLQRLRAALSVFLYGPRTADVPAVIAEQTRACRDNAAQFPGEADHSAPWPRVAAHGIGDDDTNVVAAGSGLNTAGRSQVVAALCNALLDEGVGAYG